MPLSRSPFGSSNLPPGVTDSDIEQAYGDEEDFCPECHRAWPDCICPNNNDYSDEKEL
jgi:hypothetical protein